MESADIAGGQDAARPQLSTREAAQRAGVNERTVRRAISDGRLSAVQIEGAYRIAPVALAAWMSARAGWRGHSARGADPGEGAGRAADRADLVPAALYREERDRVEALNQQLRDTASLVGMLRGRLEVVEAERDRLLALSAGDVEDAPRDAIEAPLRGVGAAEASGTKQAAWRRWWRRVTGDGSR
jgi:excisionase family DNA binding protein